MIYVAIFMILHYFYEDLFTRFVWSVLNNRDLYNDPITLIFPQFIKCEIDDRYHFMAHGLKIIECKVPYNYWNEKFVVFILIWLIIMVILMFFSLVWEFSFLFKSTRKYYFESSIDIKSLPSNSHMLLYLIHGNASRELFDEIVQQILHVNGKSIQTPLQIEHECI